MKKVFLDISHDACWTSQLDLKKQEQFFLTNGYELVFYPAAADMIVLNTCAYDQQHEDESLIKLKRFKKLNPKANVVVAGCLSKISPDSLKNAGILLAASPMDEGRAYDEIKDPPLPGNLIRHSGKIRIEALILHFSCAAYILFKKIGLLTKGLRTINAFGQASSSKTIFIRVARGCIGRCSFCAIRYARGRLISRPIEDIAKEISESCDKGFKNIYLVADNLGAYGLDIGGNICFLLDAIHSLGTKCELYLGNCEPEPLLKFKQDFISLFSKNIISYVCIPLQSGSDDLIAKMNRNYKVKDVINLMKSIKAVSPNTVISTMLLVGFPGETQEDFEMTLKLFKENVIDFAIINSYSERPNTAAINLQPKVTAEEKNRRFRKVSLINNVRLLKDIFILR